MKILITGCNGFVASNLIAHLKRKPDIQLLLFSKKHSLETLDDYLINADFIYHLAGVNRPLNIEEFQEHNVDLTNYIISFLIKNNKQTPILFSSSTQAELDNEYGVSKKKAENIIFKYAKKMETQCYIYRLPNVFGKWSKPNYNSVIATWCYNISRNKKITVNDSNTLLDLVYIDDVISSFLEKINTKNSKDITKDSFYNINPVFKKSLGEIMKLLSDFKNNRDSLIVPNVGSGFERALYATYLSYININDFKYEINGHSDSRGTFYEMLKTFSSGQFSISTTEPGITRGNHYHHTKNEKFLVVKGKGQLEYRNILTNEKKTYYVSDKKMEIIEMIPGYTHNIKNIGDEKMILLLWANEVYDENNPDTFYEEI